MYSPMFECFFVSTSMGDFAIAKRVYRSFPILLSNRVTLVDLVDFDMLEFDIGNGLVTWLFFSNKL